MRWIDRGQEPTRVAGYDKRYTKRWIDYQDSKDQTGRPSLAEPQDHEWSYFGDTLGKQSGNNCWYCERQCQPVGGWTPTVDHFRPRSLFPELTYQWSNWVFSCRRCNVENKQDKWSDTEYVDPCAIDITNRPEHYFDYESETGRMIAKDGLSESAHQRAWNTIDDLGLSKTDLVNPRFTSIKRFIEELLEELLDYSPDTRQSFIENFLELSSKSRVAYLIYGASSSEQPVEYPGLKAMVAERLLRENQLSPI